MNPDSRTHHDHQPRRAAMGLLRDLAPGARIGVALGVAAAALVAAAWSLPRAAVGVIVLLGAATALVVALCRGRSPALRLVMLAALAIRVAVLVAGLFLPLQDSKADTPIYQDRAVFLVHAGWSVIAGDLIDVDRAGADSVGLANAYSGIMATLYRISGSTDLHQAEALNVAAGTLTVFLVFLIAGRLAGEGAALRAAWMAALFPALVLYSVVVMREAMTVLALIAGAHFAVDWWRRSRWWSLVAAAACLLVGSLLHSGVMAALLALGLVAGFRILRPTAHGLRATVGGLAVIALVIGLVVGTGVGLEKLTNASNGISVQTIADNQTLAARGNTAYLSGFVPKRWVDLVWQTPVRMVYFLYGPLVLLSPLRNIGYVLLLFDGLLYVAMSIAIARRWRTIRATPGAPLLAFMAICLIGIFAIGVSNFGTAFRHRQKIAALLIPLVALPRSPTAEATGSASATSSAG